MNLENINIPHASGIDTLYYYAESGAFYDEKYIEILDQIEMKKKEFENFGIAYQDANIIISINEIDIRYSGRGRDGFEWFRHEFFRIGFKDENKNKNVNDICVQLNAIGIYTLGLGSLIEYVNKKLLKGFLLKSGKFPITRIDVNMFIEHNFSYLCKEMVVSKKKDHSILYSEKANSREVETYYIGKPPFKLRIYNKLQELKTASELKKELMFNYFGIHGINYEKTVWNVEFEIHREFLRRYGIDTIEDALKRSNELFKLGCELVRFVDTDSIKETQINSKNRRLANTLPIWEYIKNHYDNREFLQITTPLQRIEKISYRYTLEDAKKPIARAIKRVMQTSSAPTLNYFLKIIQEVKKEFATREQIEYIIDNEKEDLSVYSDEGLIKYEKSLTIAMKNEEHDSDNYNELAIIYQDVYDELVKRGLIEPMPF